MSDNNIVNDRNVQLNSDGTFTVHFGSAESCGNKANRLDITEGWNFLMRVYRPGPPVLKREYRLPAVEPVSSSDAKLSYASERNDAGEIVVDERRRED